MFVFITETGTATAALDARVFKMLSLVALQQLFVPLFLPVRVRKFHIKTLKLFCKL